MPVEPTWQLGFGARCPPKGKSQYRSQWGPQSTFPGLHEGYRLSWMPPQFRCGGSSPQCLSTWLCLELGPLKRQLSSNEWTLTCSEWCPYKNRRLGCRHTEGQPWEDRGRTEPLTSLGERPQETPDLPAPSSRTSNHQICVEINFCFQTTQPALQQPEPTSPHGLRLLFLLCPHLAERRLDIKSTYIDYDTALEKQRFNEVLK